MFPEKERLISLLEDIIKETDILFEMSEQIKTPDDFVMDMSGMILFRACSMSLQYITECFVKIKNNYGGDFFKPYSSIPWQSVFGMRNFLSHGYGDVDSESIFNTIKTDIPDLLKVTEQMLADVKAQK